LRNVEIMEKLFELFPESRRTRAKAMMDGPIGMAYVTAPASTRLEFHSCYLGGLLAHSLNVVANLRKLVGSLCSGKYDDPTLAFVGLFHDLGKAGTGTKDLYVPEPSDWHREKLGQLYQVNPDLQYMSTGERSLFNLQRYNIELSNDEYLAIKLNDGQYVDENRSYRMREPELALLVHWADMWSVRQEKA